MEKGTKLEPLLNGFLVPGKEAAESLFSSDTETDDGITKEKEEPHILAPKRIESRRGWLQRLLGRLNQVDSEREMDSAHRTYAAYCKSLDIALVDAAFKHYMEASRSIQRREWGLLYSCGSAALARYERNGKTQQDLERLIRMGNEAMASWPDRMKPTVYGVRIAYAVGKANNDLYLQSIKKEGPNEPKGDEEAFKLARECFTKVIDNERVGNASRVARMLLGILIVKRCRTKKVAGGLNIAILHLECALKQTDQLEETPSTSWDALRITGNLGLAHYFRYVHQVKSRIIKRGSRSGRLHNVNSALDNMERTRTQWEQMESPKMGFPKLPFTIFRAGMLVLRWTETRKQSHAEEAKTALEVVRATEKIDEGLKLRVDRLLSIIRTSL